MARTNITLSLLTQQDIARFWSKVNKTPGQGPNGECWEWTGGKHGNGNYGGFGFGSRTNKTRTVAMTHRVAFFAAFGIDPGDEKVCHACDNGYCCRPEHLFKGTQTDNVKDMVSKKRAYWQNPNYKHWVRHSDAKIAQLKSMYATGNYSQVELSKLFKISKQHTHEILNNKRRQ